MRFSPWLTLVLSSSLHRRSTNAFNHHVKTKAPFGLSRSTTLRLASSERTETTTTSTEESSLPSLFPSLSTPLNKLGFSTPTAIQSASAKRSLKHENLLLIAPTGSGKTLAYLLPALSKAIEEDGTILVVSPTRELAVQLMRDTHSLLSSVTEDPDAAVVLAVRGVDIPTPEELDRALVMIGTPVELLTVLRNIKGGYEFLGSDALSAVILDEVDVLLPPPPKMLRTALDKKNKKNQKIKASAQEDRRKQEQKRKLMAAKRGGADLDDSKRLVAPSERILGMVAMCRAKGSVNSQPISPPLVLAGSATASRKTLDQLNRAMRNAAEEASSSFDLVWAKDVKACRPEQSQLEEVDKRQSSDVNNNNEEEQSAKSPHTIRSVTVPSQVKHQYISLSKEQASSAPTVLSHLARAVKIMKPQTALLFICGEFGKAKTSAKAITRNSPPKGATSKARRNNIIKQKKKAAAAIAAKHKSGATQNMSTVALSARKACSTLAEHDIVAQPLHVALGLEFNAKDDHDEQDHDHDTPPLLVTFEGSARGLHFDNVDAVFVVGRPASAASYLHLAGRVGRSSAGQDGNVFVRPGTVVSLCTKGSATELEKWTRQIGGTALEELIL